MQSKKWQVRECTFQLEVSEAMAKIRFPCSYFYEWKTANGKHQTSSQNRVKAVNGSIVFNDSIQMNVLMICDTQTEKYKKKQSVIMVNLVSNSRPNEPKLVGRVSVDLADVANNSGNDFKQHNLDYCSVQAWIKFRVCFKSQKSTNLNIGDMDRSEMSQSDFGSSEVDPKRKQQIKSEVLGSYTTKNILRQQSSHTLSRSSKAIEMNTSERLRKLREQKAELARSDVDSPYTHQINQTNSRSTRPLKYAEDVPQISITGVNQDINFPTLTRNASGFNSSKISDGTMKRDKSDEHFSKFGTKIQQVDKDITSQKPKTDKVITDRTIKEDQSGASCRDVIAHHQEHNGMKTNNISEVINTDIQKTEVNELKIRVEQLQQENRKLTESSNDFESKVNELSWKNQQLIQQSSNKEAELTLLNNSYQQLQKIMAQKETTYKQQNQQLRSKVAQQQQQIGQLTQKLQELMVQIETATSIPSNPDNHIQNELNQELAKLRHNLESQQMKHENTKVELTEVRQFYNDLQQRAENMSTEIFLLETKLQNLQQQRENTQHQENFKINEQIESLKKTLESKDEQIKKIKEQMNQSEQSRVQVDVSLTKTYNELEEYSVKIKKCESEMLESKNRERQLKASLDRITQQCEYKEMKIIELTQNLQTQQQKLKEIDLKFETERQKFENTLRDKDQQYEVVTSRINDLVARLKEREQAIAKHQRQSQNFKNQLTQLEFANQQYKQKLKNIDKERLTEGEKIASLEHELQIIKSKTEKETQNNLRQQTRLRNLYEEQQVKRKELEKIKKQLENKLQNTVEEPTSQPQEVESLKLKIESHIDKQKFLIENLELMQTEVNTISTILQQKDQKIQQSFDLISQLNENKEQLVIRIHELENQLALNNQRCEALEGQVELLNAYMPEDQDQNELVQLNKKVADKNKELLSQMEDKNLLIADLQKEIGQLRANHQRSNKKSSQQEQHINQLQNKIIQLTEENQKLYEEFNRVNMKYQEQLQAIDNNNSQKILQLIKEIDALRKGNQQKEKKQLESIKESSRGKEKIQKLEECINLKQFRIQVLSNELKQAKQINQNMKGQIEVLNSQYESVYSQLGEKEFQLYQTTSKLRDLEQKFQTQLATPPAINSHEKQQFKAKHEFYQNQIARLRERYDFKEKQLQGLQQELEIYKKNMENQKLQSHQNKTDAAESKEIEERYSQRIKEMEEHVQHLNFLVKEKDKECEQARTEKMKLEVRVDQMESERQFLKGDPIEPIKDKSGISTPIYQFDESPSHSISQIGKKGKPDLTNVVDEINAALNKRKEQQQLESVLRLVIQTNTRNQDEMEKLSRDRGTIQQKAKLASKEIQKVKSQIMKNTSKSILEKSQLTTMLRPTEQAINELINLSETLADIDLEIQLQQAEADRDEGAEKDANK